MLLGLDTNSHEFAFTSLRIKSDEKVAEKELSALSSRNPEVIALYGFHNEYILTNSVLSFMKSTASVEQILLYGNVKDRSALIPMELFYEASSLTHRTHGTFNRREGTPDHKILAVVGHDHSEYTGKYIDAVTGLVDRTFTTTGKGVEIKFFNPTDGASDLIKTMKTYVLSNLLANQKIILAIHITSMDDRRIPFECDWYAKILKEDLSDVKNEKFLVFFATLYDNSTKIRADIDIFASRFYKPEEIHQKVLHLIPRAPSSTRALPEEPATAPAPTNLVVLCGNVKKDDQKDRHRKPLNDFNDKTRIFDVTYDRVSMIGSIGVDQMSTERIYTFLTKIDKQILFTKPLTVDITLDVTGTTDTDVRDRQLELIIPMHMYKVVNVQDHGSFKLKTYTLQLLSHSTHTKRSIMMISKFGKAHAFVNKFVDALRMELGIADERLDLVQMKLQDNEQNRSLYRALSENINKAQALGDTTVIYSSEAAYYNSMAGSGLEALASDVAHIDVNRNTSLLVYSSTSRAGFPNLPDWTTSEGSHSGYNRLLHRASEENATIFQIAASSAAGSFEILADTAVTNAALEGNSQAAASLLHVADNDSDRAPLTKADADAKAKSHSYVEKKRVIAQNQKAYRELKDLITSSSLTEARRKRILAVFPDSQITEEVVRILLELMASTSRHNDFLDKLEKFNCSDTPYKPKNTGDFFELHALYRRLDVVLKSASSKNGTARALFEKIYKSEIDAVKRCVDDSKEALGLRLKTKSSSDEQKQAYLMKVVKSVIMTNRFVKNEAERAQTDIRKKKILAINSETPMTYEATIILTGHMASTSEHNAVLAELEEFDCAKGKYKRIPEGTYIQLEALNTKTVDFLRKLLDQNKSASDVFEKIYAAEIQAVFSCFAATADANPNTKINQISEALQNEKNEQVVQKQQDGAAQIQLAVGIFTAGVIRDVGGPTETVPPSANEPSAEALRASQTALAHAEQTGDAAALAIASVLSAASLAADPRGSEALTAALYVVLKQENAKLLDKALAEEAAVLPTGTHRTLTRHKLASVYRKAILKSDLTRERPTKLTVAVCGIADKNQIRDKIFSELRIDANDRASVDYRELPIPIIKKETQTGSAQQYSHIVIGKNCGQAKYTDKKGAFYLVSYQPRASVSVSVVVSPHVVDSIKRAVYNSLHVDPTVAQLDDASILITIRKESIVEADRIWTNRARLKSKESMVVAASGFKRSFVQMEGAHLQVPSSHQDKEVVKPQAPHAPTKVVYVLRAAPAKTDAIADALTKHNLTQDNGYDQKHVSSFSEIPVDQNTDTLVLLVLKNDDVLKTHKKPLLFTKVIFDVQNQDTSVFVGILNTAKQLVTASPYKDLFILMKANNMYTGSGSVLSLSNIVIYSIAGSNCNQLSTKLVSEIINSTSPIASALKHAITAKVPTDDLSGCHFVILNCSDIEHLKTALSNIANSKLTKPDRIVVCIPHGKKADEALKSITTKDYTKISEIKTTTEQKSKTAYCLLALNSIGGSAKFGEFV
jgi:hypothetical protein